MAKNPLEDALAAASLTPKPSFDRKVGKKEMKRKTRSASNITEKQSSVVASTRRKRSFREFVHDEIDSEAVLPKLVWKNQKSNQKQAQYQSSLKQQIGKKSSESDRLDTLNKSTLSSGLLQPPSVASVANKRLATDAGRKIKKSPEAQDGISQTNQSGNSAAKADQEKEVVSLCNSNKCANSEKKGDCIPPKVISTNMKASQKKKRKRKNRKFVMKANVDDLFIETNGFSSANTAKTDFTSASKEESKQEKNVDKALNENKNISDIGQSQTSGLEAALHQVEDKDFISTDKSIDETQVLESVDVTNMHHTFSKLIDQAARDQWELLEVGKLVRLFASTWEFDDEKTAVFILQHCPELVNLDFLEGLNLKIRSADIFSILDHGSGNMNVLLNKTTSLIENHAVKTSDPAFLSFLNKVLIPRGQEEYQDIDGVTEPTDLPDQNGIIKTLIKVMESCTHVCDVGVILQSVYESWPFDRVVSLVQVLLLSPIFDDLEGSDRDLLPFLPRGIEARLEFPNRMDDEDADENGNLKGWIVDDEDGEIDTKGNNHTSGSENDNDDSDSDSAVQSGESDSDEEKAAAGWNPQRRTASNRFVMDEAEEGDDTEDDDDTSKEICDAD
uniref:Uncharacterized protein AlNc14C12G1442 n=1 Tax=Albugo laibachii Nc14 TaxID=890382 RepID=F0W365_9STRA|nr:conserved hypothetical protein [Albugo laibachii Nc14]|eukprot:CCA15505.1 conserved hypothetical protein [Albugo laibachii Nc14]